MKARYLEITFWNGRVLAAYLYLPRDAGVRSARTEEVVPGVLADYGPTGDVIGLELTAPTHVTVERINRILVQLGHSRLEPEELGPLAHAA